VLLAAKRFTEVQRSETPGNRTRFADGRLVSRLILRGLPQAREATGRPALLEVLHRLPVLDVCEFDLMISEFKC